MGRVTQRTGTDAIGQFIDMAERVRKLEVMSASLTVRPKRWEPTVQDEFMDAVVRHVIGMAPWQQDANLGAPPWGGMPLTFQSRESSYFRDIMESGENETGEGFYFDSGEGRQVGIDMTTFLRALTASPQAAISPITFTRARVEDPPHAEVQVGGAVNPNTEGEPKPWYRWHAYRDMYPATWSFVGPGVTFVYPGNTPTPDLGGQQMNGVTLAPNGCYVKDSESGKLGAPYWWVIGQDNCIWIGATGDAASDCENTGELLSSIYSVYNPRQAGGVVIGPDLMGQWCEKFGQQWVAGGQYGVYIVASPYEYVLRGPPLPAVDQAAATVLRTDFEAAALGVQIFNGNPGWEWLRDHIQWMFDHGVVPSLLSWYQRQFDKAKASRSPDWQWVHTNGYMRGTLEASVRDKHVFLRGELVYPGSWAQLGPAAAFLASEIPAPANYGSYVTFPARDGYGRDAQLMVQPFGDMWTITPTIGVEGLINGDSHKIVFDGVQWATDQDIE